MKGIKNGSLTDQLVNFSMKLSEYDGTLQPQILNDWQVAFWKLSRYLETLNASKKYVIFMNEISWMDTPKSGFIQLFAHFWNDYLSKQSHFLLVICSSATCWTTKKIINDSGGFYQRITERIHLYALQNKQL
jgi:uncharacterized protein